MQSFRSRLQQAREAKGLSVQQAANAIAVEEEEWREWETGISFPDCVQGLNVAELLGVDEFELFLGRSRRKK